MSKRSKLLAVLLSVCLLFSAIAVLFASAENAGKTLAIAESVIDDCTVGPNGLTEYLASSNSGLLFGSENSKKSKFITISHVSDGKGNTYARIHYTAGALDNPSTFYPSENEIAAQIKREATIRWRAYSKYSSAADVSNFKSITLDFDFGADAWAYTYVYEGTTVYKTASSDDVIKAELAAKNFTDEEIKAVLEAKTLAYPTTLKLTPVFQSSLQDDSNLNEVDASGNNKNLLSSSSSNTYWKQNAAAGVSVTKNSDGWYLGNAKLSGEIGVFDHISFVFEVSEGETYNDVVESVITPKLYVNGEYAQTLSSWSSFTRDGATVTNAAKYNVFYQLKMEFYNDNTSAGIPGEKMYDKYSFAFDNLELNYYTEDDGEVTESSKEAVEDGKFLYYNANAKTYTIESNDDFTAKLDAMSNGSVIKLLSDVHVVIDRDNYPNGAELPDIGAGNVYLDLNGYQLSMQVKKTSDTSSSITAGGNYALLNVQSDTNFYVYSSDNASTASIHVIHTMEDAEGGTEAGRMGPIFGMTASDTKNAHIYLGDVTNAKILSYSEIDDSGNVISGDITDDSCNGDNLNTYAPRLFWGGRANGKALPASNSSLHVGGGTHYSVSALSGGSMIDASSGVDFYATRAKLISTIKGSIVSFSRNETLVGDNYYSAPSDGNVEMTDCTLYTEGTVISNLYESDLDVDFHTKESHVKFDGCTLIGNTIHTLAKGEPEYIDCKFNNPVSIYQNKDSTVLARTNVIESISFPTANWAGFWDVTKLEGKLIPIAYAVANDSDCVDITWVVDGNATTEKWVNSDVYPAHAFSAPSSDVYTYDYLPKITTTEESGDCTYTLTPIIKFTVQANVFLHSSFTFNLYIPKTAGDSDTITGKWIESADGTRLTDVTFDESKTQVISGVEHYVVSQDILATEGDSEYRLVIEMKGAFGETVTKELEFSIFDYADKVEAANFTDSAKDLVRATRTYIKATMNYFAYVDNKVLPYKDVDTQSLLDIASNNKNDTQIKENSETPYFSGATLSPGKQVGFVFYFTDNAGGNVTFSYTENLKRVEKTVDVSGGSAYVLYLRAADLCGRITADINGDGDADYSYSLANYLFAKQDANDTLVALNGAIWAYSEAARAYIKDTSTPDTPTVNISIAGEEVNSENYVIVADLEEYGVAKALKDAILTKTGKRLDILRHTPAGKNGIYVNLTEPTHAYDFEAIVKGNDLVINCSFKSFIEDGMANFINKNIATLNKNYDFASNFVDSYYTDKIYYSDFDVPTVDMDKITSINEDYGNINTWYNDDVCCGGEHTVLDTIKESGVLETALYALVKTHDFANVSRRHTICADDSAIYYINTVDVKDTNQIVIKTNVNWGNARFILDDSELQKSSSEDVFVVKSHLEASTITDKATLEAIASQAVNLTPTTKKIDLTLGYRAMIVTLNSEHKVFRRQGAYRGSGNLEGEAMQELIVIDEEGNLDPTTPPIFTYSNLDSLTVYNIDIPKITISGGNITTIVPEYIKPGRIEDRIQIGRGFDVRRPNTRVENLNHNIIGEHKLQTTEENGVKKQVQMNGATYHGFFCATNTSDVTFYNCKLQGRRLYASGRSSYEISTNMVNNCVFDTCEQTNFYVNPDTYFADAEISNNTQLSLSALNKNFLQPCWGTMGGNNLKNFAYVNSRIARLDAHKGLCNGKIINSDIQLIAIGGWGDFTVENSNIHSSGTLISLRSDYGYTWNGTLTLKNVAALYSSGTQKIVSSQFTNWDFGYKCQFPDVLIDGLTYYKTLGTKEITGNDLLKRENGDVVTAETVDQINMYGHDFQDEPNLHLEETASTLSIYKMMIGDKNGDGIMDGSEKLPWNTDGKISGSLHDKSIKVEFTKTSTYVLPMSQFEKDGITEIITEIVSGYKKYPVVDADNDGYVDDSTKFDVNGDGKVGIYTVDPEHGIPMSAFEDTDTKEIETEIPASYKKYSIVDKDLDGYVDNSFHFDVNGDGVVIPGAGAKVDSDGNVIEDTEEDGNGEEEILKYEMELTNIQGILHSEIVEKAGDYVDYAFRYNGGNENRNITKAPTNITIVNNTQGYNFETYLNDALKISPTIEGEENFFAHTAISIGLKYEVSEDGTYAKVVGYNGTATEVVIADEYNGLPVKLIDNEAFKSSSITSITIPKSVTRIGTGAFRYCSDLVSATFENPYDWFLADSLDATSGTELTLYNNDEEGNATALKKHLYKYWICGTDVHEHAPLNTVEENLTEATCTENGSYDSVVYCSCGEELSRETILIDAKGHTEVTDAAVEPTCTETGLTEGKHCSVCGEITVKQTVVDAKGHTEVTDEAVAPTCTETGLTEGKHCSVCGEVTVTQETVPAAHTNIVTDEAVAPTCTETGLTEGKHCEACGEVIVTQETVPAAHTNVVTDEAVAPTCTETGLTEGKHCEACGETIEEQEVVPATGHHYVGDSCEHCGAESPYGYKEEDSPLIPIG